MTTPSIGIIGGTGLYDIDGFDNAHPCGACDAATSRPTTPELNEKKDRIGVR